MNRKLPASLVCIAAAAVILTSPANVAALAFTGAEGYGANATGGTNTCHVTNLDDSGAGSFREAATKNGNRVVFDVAGTIELKSEVVIASDVTIDGTTAPTNGITIHGHTVSVSGRNNIIIRNIRFREDMSGPRGKCSLQGAGCSNILVDHCSIEWGRWDCMSFTGKSHDITVQWCIIGAGIDPQRFGTLLDTADRISLHHNLYINNQSRNPKFKANGQYICNVIYNWGGGGGFVGGHSSAVWSYDLINNYFIAGPSSRPAPISQCNTNDHIYAVGNFKDVDKDGTRNGTAVAESEIAAQKATLQPSKQHNPAVPVTIDNATHTVDQALAGALGCQPNDSVDVELISSLRSYGTVGRISE